MIRLDWNLLFTVINLLLWYVIIRKFLFKPINEVISKREEAIQSRYQEAQRLTDEAKANKESYAAFQADMEEEKKKAITQAREDAHVEYEHILEDARKKAEQILETSRKEALLEKEKIVGKAEQEIRTIILDTAIKTMQSSRNDNELYDQFLTKAGETTHAEN